MNYGVLNSPKTRMLGQFSVHKIIPTFIFGRIEDTINCFRDLRTFRKTEFENPNSRLLNQKAGNKVQNSGFVERQWLTINNCWERKKNNLVNFRNVSDSVFSMKIGRKHCQKHSRNNFLVPRMIELPCQTFMPSQTLDLHRVIT